MSDYYLGLDGGGTKTTAALSDEHGNILCTLTGESINYYSEGMEQARAHFAAILDLVRERTGANSLRGVCIGSSALYGRASNEELAAFAGGVCDAPHIYMDSDLFIALEAMLCEGPCGVVISGTGSMAAARKCDGSLAVKGGYGYLLGDEGSGYRIGLAGIQAAVSAYEGASEPTALTAALQAKFNVVDLHDLIELFYDPQIERKVIADFAKQVLTCTKAGDATAHLIVCEAAHALAATTAALLRECGTVPLGVFGGMFTHHPLYFNAFCEGLQAVVPDASVRHLPLPPVRGAVLAAMKAAGLSITQEIRANLLHEAFSI